MTEKNGMTGSVAQLVAKAVMYYHTLHRVSKRIHTNDEKEARK